VVLNTSLHPPRTEQKSEWIENLHRRRFWQKCR
jgi:hypothetical protein